MNFDEEGIMFVEETHDDPERYKAIKLVVLVMQSII